jgi:hypothetical protein
MFHLMAEGSPPISRCAGRDGVPSAPPPGYRIGQRQKAKNDQLLKSVQSELSDLRRKACEIEGEILH